MATAREIVEGTGAHRTASLDNINVDSPALPASETADGLPMDNNRSDANMELTKREIQMMQKHDEERVRMQNEFNDKIAILEITIQDLTEENTEKEAKIVQMQKHILGLNDCLDNLGRKNMEMQKDLIKFQERKLTQFDNILHDMNRKIFGIRMEIPWPHVVREINPHGFKYACVVNSLFYMVRYCKGIPVTFEDFLHILYKQDAEDDEYVEDVLKYLLFQKKLCSDSVEKCVITNWFLPKGFILDSDSQYVKNVNEARDFFKAICKRQSNVGKNFLVVVSFAAYGHAVVLRCRGMGSYFVDASSIPNGNWTLQEGHMDKFLSIILYTVTDEFLKLFQDTPLGDGTFGLSALSMDDVNEG